eukprot:CAMPEP_0174698976 /NCGR_PEP_ID=MMETSP1094-20130205/4407_1 /TAXON_ID=156173 /ORGANISM="Chrysochromulina brevifilum, Strain UTEX LB 985" /LENGTH=257 /DNA_ID=CAMNT_0015896231 /DNA_START=59 /DNA_END=835 /DNA_ORIENTATION=+
MIITGSAASLLLSAASTPHPLVFRRVTTCRCSSATPASVLQRCREAFLHLDLDTATSARASKYVEELLRYNERTNVYSKTAYDKLPFHVADSLTLAIRIREASPRGCLDLGSGSGLPSVLIACVNPDVPVYAVESKSRKTKFLQRVAQTLDLASYVPLTQNVNELSRSWCFDVDIVTAKAFKPLPEVGPIGRRCISSECCRMIIPISEAQVAEFALREDQLERHGDGFLYYSESISASHGTAQRKLISVEAVKSARL